MLAVAHFSFHLFCFLAGESFPAGQGSVAKVGVQLDGKTFAGQLFASNKGRPGPAKRLVDGLAFLAMIRDCPSGQSYRLLCRMRVFLRIVPADFPSVGSFIIGPAGEPMRFAAAAFFEAVKD